MDTNTQEERLREPMFFGQPEPLLEPDPAEQEQLLLQEAATNPILKAKIAEPRNARMALSAVSSHSRQEHYGTEPPAPGWTNAGPMKWVKDGSGGTPKVAIVGGGPAGLFAAYILQQRLPEAGITIFEASSRLGGKIQTASFGDGTPFEAGVAELYEYKGGKEIDAAFGMVGDEWHGPEAPGPGWVDTGRPGPRGGKVWKKQGGGQAAPERSFKSYAQAIKGKIQSGEVSSALEMYKKAPPEAFKDIYDEIGDSGFNVMNKYNLQQQSQQKKQPQKSAKAPKVSTSLPFRQGADRDSSVKVEVKNVAAAAESIFPSIESLIKDGLTRIENNSQWISLPRLYEKTAEMNGGKAKYTPRQFAADLVTIARSDENYSLGHAIKFSPADTTAAKDSRKSIFLPKDIKNPLGEGSYYIAANYKTKTNLYENIKLKGEIERNPIISNAVDIKMATDSFYTKDPLRALIEDDLGLATVNMSGGGVVLRGKVLRDLDDLEKEFGKKTRKAVEKFHEKCAELMTLKQYSQRWQPDNSHPWANKTFRECIEEELGDDEAAMDYVETACASDLAIESRSCNGLNGIKNVLLDNADYMQLYHVNGGIERVSQALSGRVNADVRLTTRVVSIAKHDDSYRVNYQHDGRDEVEDFDYVILAMPNHWLTQLRFDEPEMKEAIQAFLAHYDAPAHYFRVTMLFDKPWWERFDFPGEFWMMDLCNGCCVYDESKRWGRKSGGHVLSFLLAGTDALLMCSGNQSPSEIAQHVLDGLPAEWRYEARGSLLECRMDTWAGSICAQPGGWPVAELRQEHQPEPEDHPGILLVCDSLFDSTLNGALISANVAVELLLEQAELEGQPATKAIEALASDKKGL